MTRHLTPWGVLLALVLVSGACAAAPDGSSRRSAQRTPSDDDPGGATPGMPGAASRAPAPAITDWVYQLQRYHGGGRLDALARAPQHLVVIDLARDAGADVFRPEEIAVLRGAGKTVLAYFEIGSIEEFRPEYAPLRDQAGELILDRWEDWPDEHFVRYWDPRWWERVVEPRIDQALAAGFDGAYLDTPLAYEELDLSLVPGETRASLARAMVDLIERVSRYAKSRRPGFLIVPQNSPELREYDGYTEAIDGVGMEELFFRATDRPCTEGFCRENLEHARALRDAGKVVLAVDYATDPANVRTACARYRAEGFAGYVTVPELDRIGTPCA
ncbi:MAG TPA: endo alpha-1,4 polygalactosaminidase [Acidimicrobiales bacterium]|nr:endo alpha-1,4 polygalactosaminidase [Acidimicrobiales bacterium]